LGLAYPVGAVYQRANWDDLYLTDSTDFLGDCRVECLIPSGNGNSSQWVGSDATSTDNYLLVDETSLDGDTTYVEADSVGDKDTYAMDDLETAAGTVYAVQTILAQRKTDAGSRQVAPVLRHSGTDYDGTSVSVGDTYAFGIEIEEQNPGTSSAWSIADVNAIEFGAKVTV